MAGGRPYLIPPPQPHPYQAGRTLVMLCNARGMATRKLTRATREGTAGPPWGVVCSCLQEHLRFRLSHKPLLFL